MNPAGGGRAIWLNGHIMPLESACISPLDRGFLYGDGLFETIRAEEGRALYLRQHIERLCGSLARLRIVPDPAPDWAFIVSGLLRENGLDRGAASLKIIVTRGIASPLGLPASTHPTVLVTAQRYEPPALQLYERGMDLLIYREGYAPPLAAHKSLNYLYHLTARQAALDAGCGEAVLLDGEGRVTETSAGSLVAMTGGVWWTPKSEYLLPGVTITGLSAILRETGCLIESREARPEDLVSAERVWVLNSLIGIMPAGRINGSRVLDPAPGEAARLRALLFERGAAGSSFRRTLESRM